MRVASFKYQNVCGGASGRYLCTPRTSRRPYVPNVPTYRRYTCARRLTEQIPEVGRDYDQLRESSR